MAADADADADAAAAPGDLHRFVEAQDADRTDDRALDELRARCIRTHRTWFVLPQRDGLGTSAMAQRHGIRSVGAARSNLRHPALDRCFAARPDPLTGARLAGSPGGPPRL